MVRACKDTGLISPCFEKLTYFDDKSLLPDIAGCGQHGPTWTMDNKFAQEMCEPVMVGVCPSFDKLSVRTEYMESSKSACGNLPYGNVFCTEPKRDLEKFVICGEKQGKLRWTNIVV